MNFQQMVANSDCSCNSDFLQWSLVPVLLILIMKGVECFVCRQNIMFIKKFVGKIF